MGLAQYKQKRSVNKTPEPFGGEPEGTQLRFVIQKHAASHLHYDFRLEMDGVLKSWAVPKGPSTDPAAKRLAMMVEDHPFDYRSFEGIIPQSEYGGGTVMVWDEGTYEPIEPITGKENQEKFLLKQLKSGSLKIKLKGHKLKGEFALVKTKGMGDNAWLLIKHNDQYAKDTDITIRDKSVLSKKTLDQIAKTSTNIYATKSVKKADAKTTENPPTKTTAKKGEKQSGKLEELLCKAKKKAFYTRLEPMLAKLVAEPFDEKGWTYEIKWDGYRAIAFKNKGKLELKSRNHKSFNEKFHSVYESLRNWDADVIADGEIVVIDKNGKANFGALQQWRTQADGTLVYYVFDLIWYKGHDLTALPLHERKSILKEIMPADIPQIKLSEDFETSGTKFLASAKKMKLEGIMAKRSDSRYSMGDRSNDWLKIKANQRQEMVIGGFSLNEGTGKLFSSLLLGVYDNGALIYTGKVGTGFSNQVQETLMKAMKPLVIKKCPFTDEPDVNKPGRFKDKLLHASATWVKPQLICEVSFTEMTEDGVMRHPSFEGMRDDKKALEVIKEEAVAKPKASVKKKLAAKSAQKKTKKVLLNEDDDSQIKKVGGHELKFTNLGKIYWPKEKITKRDMINYYAQAAPFILPYLKNRPQSLNRYPDGINGFNFYQKDVSGKVPEWAETYLYHTDEDPKDKHFLLGNNEATLLYMASLGCIEMHPWNSTILKPDYPSWCIIDLDPGKNSFEEVIEAALVTKEVLDEMSLACYCKTSGSTGLHVYIPLGEKYTYDQSKEFARVVVTLVQRRLPEFTTLERVVSKRKGKMYLDFLQNRAHATIAAPYSLRPKPGATVSMPLHWEEVRSGLKMTDFTINNAIQRMNESGDIFKPVLGKGVDLKTAIKNYQEH